MDKRSWQKLQWLCLALGLCGTCTNSQGFPSTSAAPLLGGGSSYWSRAQTGLSFIPTAIKFTFAWSGAGVPGGLFIMLNISGN